LTLGAEINGSPKMEESAKSLPATMDIAVRVWVTLPDGTHHYCTGMFVQKNLVVTAAHCVEKNGTDEKYTVDKFILEKDASEYYPKAGCIFPHPNWGTVTDKWLRIRYDYAFIQTTKEVTADPKDIKDIDTGSYGTAVTLLGYASEDPMAHINAIDGKIDLDILHPTVAESTTPTLGFTRGTSGGPWVDATTGKPNMVLSLNSSYETPLYDDTHIRIYGPLFDKKESKDLEDNAAMCK